MPMTSAGFSDGERAMHGLLTGDDIQRALLPPDERNQWSKTFETHSFDQLPEGKGIGIAPVGEGNIGPISYDLTVGGEALSLRRAQKTQLRPGGDPLQVDPGETVLVLTQEFLALGPQYGAITLSRARVMNQGVALSSAKIDPTWYGCLIVPVTNGSRSTIKLTFGEPFCTILFFKMQQPVGPKFYLSRRNTPHLGQVSLDYRPTNIVPWEPIRPEAVRDEDMTRAVDFGPPFDVVRGMFDLKRKEIIDYMEKQWSVSAMRELKRSLWEDELQQIKAHRQEEIGLLKEQINILRQQGEASKADRRVVLTLAVTLGIAVLGFLVNLFTKRP